MGCFGLESYGWVVLQVKEQYEQIQPSSQYACYITCWRDGIMVVLERWVVLQVKEQYEQIQPSSQAICMLYNVLERWYVCFGEMGCFAG